MDEKELYHKSHIRTNILECIDWSADMRVLEISGEQGALTGNVADRVSKVTCLVENAVDCGINHNINENHGNITYVRGNLRHNMVSVGEEYDVIISVVPCGVTLEDLFLQGERLLAPEGKIIFACDNRLGMKYLAGCQREPDGGFFEGIQGTKANRLYSYRELQAILSQWEGWSYQLYFPYPDQYYPMSIYSQKYLPKMGELNANGIVSKHGRLTLFNEEKAYDTIINEGLYEEFANTFLLVITRR